MAHRLRLFSISHSCVVTAYRRRFVELASKGYDVTLLTPRIWQQFNRPCTAMRHPTDDSLEHVILQPWTFGLRHHGLRNTLHVYSGLQRLIEKSRPDIVELWEEPFSAVSWQTVRAVRHRLPNCKIIFFSAQNLPRWLPPPFRWFRNSTFRHGHACFAMNDDVATVLRADGWNGLTKVLPLGVDIDLFSTASPSGELRRVLGNRPIVGFLGKLTAQKGISCLLEALELLAMKTVDVAALIVGAGDLSDVVERRLEALTLPSKLVHGVSHEDVPSILATMDIVVVPSLTLPQLKEQFGRVAIEAMAAGRALVVSDSGELPRVVGDAAIVVPEGNSAALASAIAELATDSERRFRLGEAARAHAAERYSWATVVAKQIAVHQIVTDSTHSPAIQVQ